MNITQTDLTNAKNIAEQVMLALMEIRSSFIPANTPGLKYLAQEQQDGSYLVAIKIDKPFTIQEMETRLNQFGSFGTKYGNLFDFYPSQNTPYKPVKIALYGDKTTIMVTVPNIVQNMDFNANTSAYKNAYADQSTNDSYQDGFQQINYKPYQKTLKQTVFPDGVSVGIVGYTIWGLAAYGAYNIGKNIIKRLSK